jgi:uncharacterized membrane protein
MPADRDDAGAATADSAKESIDAVAEIEGEELRHRTGAERVSDAIVGAIGTLAFVAGHGLVFLLWIVVNLGWIPKAKPFDPFPFGILTLIVSSEGVFLALFILISQNRMTRVADHRAHLNLQISLLAEREATRLLQIVRGVATHLGVPADDQETSRLAQRTHVQTLAHELEQKLPEH